MTIARRTNGGHSPPYSLLVKLDRIAEARALLRDGIEIARQQGDQHAAGEMGELLASFGTLGES